MSAPKSIQLKFCAQTNVGKVRKGNEDNFLVLDLNAETSWTGNDLERTAPQSIGISEKGVVVAVSDGMGGALAGEVASRMAVEIVRDILPQLQTHEGYAVLSLHEQLRVAIEQANAAIHIESIVNAEECRGMGATFTAVAIEHASAYFAQVGDSRAHLIRQGQITRITKDQSVVQQLIDLGQLTEAEAETHSRRNIILQALGALPEVDVIINSLPLRADDILLLCSDGLSGKVSATEMLQIVTAVEMSEACEQLIALANERGGEDNITVLLLKLSSEQLQGADDEPVAPEFIERSEQIPNEFLLEDVGLSPPGGGSDKSEFKFIENSSDLPLPAVSPLLPLEPHPNMKIEQEKKTVSGRTVILAFLAFALVLSISADFLNYYFVKDRRVLQQKLYQENQGLISSLRARIDTLRQQPDASSALNSQLDVLSKRLDEAAAMDPTKYQQIGQACSEVENAIIQLEKK